MDDFRKMRQKFTLFLLVFSVGLSAQKGIRFEHDLAFADALAFAKTEKKLIFVDAYTSWCGPAK